jgi:hypothetical protein
VEVDRGNIASNGDFHRNNYVHRNRDLVVGARRTYQQKINEGIACFGF